MPYRDDILALAPDHFWTWDNTHNDIGVGPSSPKPTNQAGGNTATLTGTPICDDLVAAGGELGGFGGALSSIFGGGGAGGGLEP